MQTLHKGMPVSAKIFVAGHRGLVGAAVVRALRAAGYENLLLRTHEELDLCEQMAVRKFFERERPEYVFLAAAKVGGILANSRYPADFIYNNLQIQANVISSAHQTGVHRLLFLGSSCIYPRDCPQPIKEEYLLTSELELTNRPYALAKIAGVEMCWAYNRQFGTEYFAVMPSNLYGPGDNYDIQNSHVLPALIRKMHESKLAGSREVIVWGTGNPRREFLYVDDLAEACLLLMNLSSEEFTRLFQSSTNPPLINVGTGEELTITELAKLVAEAVGFEGTLAFDSSKPDGTPRKILDITQMRLLAWMPRISLRDGIKTAYSDYLNHGQPISVARSTSGAFE